MAGLRLGEGLNLSEEEIIGGKWLFFHEMNEYRDQGLFCCSKYRGEIVLFWYVVLYLNPSISR